MHEFQMQFKVKRIKFFLSFISLYLRFTVTLLKLNGVCIEAQMNGKRQ